MGLLNTFLRQSNITFPSLPTIRQQLKFVIKFHLKFKIWIACRNGFKFRGWECLLVNILWSSHRCTTGHDLRNITELCFLNLPKVVIKASFSDIVENIYLTIDISLTNQASITLDNIRRFPRHIEVMNSFHTTLYVKTGSPFFRWGHENTNLTSIHLTLKLELSLFVSSIVNKSNLFFWNPTFNKQIFQLLINRETFAIRSSKVRKNHLCPFMLSFHVINLIHSLNHLHEFICISSYIELCIKQTHI